MAKLTIGQKATRVVAFLMGIRNPRIAAALEAHGFTEDDLATGWRTVAGLTKGRLGLKLEERTDPKLVEEIDAWENKWFPIVSAVLQHNHPAAHELVFRNLTQTSGPEVVVSVGTMLERLEQLPKDKAEGGLGREGRAARELLTRRGLDRKVITQAQGYLKRAAQFDPTPNTGRNVTVEEELAAEREMWRWYLEWSGIARVAISDRRLLRQLGFLQNASGKIVEDVEPEPAEPAVDGGDTDVDAPPPA